MAVVFVELGQDVHISGRQLECSAIHEGRCSGYVEGLLRCSVVMIRSGLSEYE